MNGSLLREHDRLTANAARNEFDLYIDIWNARPPWAQRRPSLVGFRHTLLAARDQHEAKFYAS
jgi:hypothetical protein